MQIPGNRVIGEYDMDRSFTINKAITLSVNNSHWKSNILDIIDDPILVTDSQGKIIFVNEAFVKFRGAAKDTLLDRNAYDFSPPSKIREVLETRKTFTGLSYRQSELVFYVEIMPILHKDELVGTILYAKDISTFNISDEPKQNYKSDPIRKSQENTIITQDTKMEEIIKKTSMYAKTELTMLITGETGTGKELFAKFIHDNSLRSKGPFIPLNCSTIGVNLIDSELFGYEDGSFTGSRKGGKAGLFEAANGGTLFLDEIGDMPLELQPRLLRVLEENCIRRVGSSNYHKIDVRIIAATNKRLDDLYDSGIFRKDLYYRLSAVHIEIPPLRNRKGDIKPITESIINNLCRNKNGNVSITNEALATLFKHNWPGNVRELKNIILSASQIASDGIITESILPEYITDNSANSYEHLKLSENDPYELRKSILLEFLSDKNQITNREYCSRIKVDRSTAYRDLSKLVAEGILSVSGKGRSITYNLKKKV